MGFRFPLATVLRLRESIEKREEFILQQIQFELSRVRHRIDELTEELAKTGIAREETLRNWIQAHRLKDWQDEMNVIVETKRHLQKTLETLRCQRETQLKVYQAARVDRKTLTDLRQQQRSTWEENQARIEQKRIDEVFTARLQRD